MLTKATIIWIIILDLTTKGIAQKFQEVPIQFNEDLAFSIKAGFLPSIIITTTLLVVIFLYYKKFQKTLTKKQELAFGLILGGALSNLLERIYAGHVTDFIKIGTGFLNLADLAIFSGIMLLLTSLVLKTEN